MRPEGGGADVGDARLEHAEVLQVEHLAEGRRDGGCAGIPQRHEAQGEFLEGRQRREGVSEPGGGGGAVPVARLRGSCGGGVEEAERGEARERRELGDEGREVLQRGVGEVEHAEGRQGAEAAEGGGGEGVLRGGLAAVDGGDCEDLEGGEV